MPLLKSKKCLKLFAAYSTILELQKVILEKLCAFKIINKEFILFYNVEN